MLHPRPFKVGKSCFALFVGESGRQMFLTNIEGRSIDKNLVLQLGERATFSYSSKAQKRQVNFVRVWPLSKLTALPGYGSGRGECRDLHEQPVSRCCCGHQKSPSPMGECIETMRKTPLPGRVLAGCLRQGAQAPGPRREICTGIKQNVTFWPGACLGACWVLKRKIDFPF